MNRLIVALVSLFMCYAGMAETKIVERSAKHVPQWVGGENDGYLIVSVRAKTLSNAEEEALQKITEAIIKSVATYIDVAQTNVMSETVNNDKVESEDMFKKQTSIIAGHLPYLKGITLANASDIYWERKVDKKTKDEFYDYMVKYPFSAGERRKLIAQYDALDSQYEAELVNLEQGVERVSSSGEISAALSRLDTLGDFFVDGVRATRVRNLGKQYKELYKELSVDGEFISDNELVCGLQLKGNHFTVPNIGSVTSSCARIVSQSSTNDSRFIIKFNSEDCLGDEINTVTVMFRVGGQRIECTFEIDNINHRQSGPEFAISPQGTIYLNAESSSSADRTVTNITVRLTIDNRGGQKFGVKGLELKVPELASDIVIDNLDMSYSTKGIIQLNAFAEGTYRIVNTASSLTSFVTGVITIVNPETESVQRVRITLPYSTNWKL